MHRVRNNSTFIELSRDYYNICINYILAQAYLHIISVGHMKVYVIWTMKISSKRNRQIIRIWISWIDKQIIIIVQMDSMKTTLSPVVVPKEHCETFCRQQTENARRLEIQILKNVKIDEDLNMSSSDDFSRVLPSFPEFYRVLPIRISIISFRMQ